MKEGKVSSINKNQKIKSWFLDDFRLYEERILLMCNSNSQSNLFKGKKETVEEILKSGEIYIQNLIKVFDMKGNPRTQIAKAVENLRGTVLSLYNEDTGHKFLIKLFDSIEKTKTVIKYEFSNEYLNYTLNNLNEGFFISLSEELKNIKSSYTPKLLRLLKSEVSLGVEEITIKIDYEYLRKALLGDKGSSSKFIDRFMFNSRVIKVALEEINGCSSLEKTNEWNRSNYIRNTFIDAKLSYQENIGTIDDPVYVYHFKVGSSKKIANEIAPESFNKSYATWELLKDYKDGIINAVNYKENNEPIVYEKTPETPKVPKTTSAEIAPESFNSSIELEELYNEEINNNKNTSETKKTPKDKTGKENEILDIPEF